MRSVIDRYFHIRPDRSRQVFYGLLLSLLTLFGQQAYGQVTEQQATDLAIQLVNAFNAEDLDELGALLDQRSLAEKVAVQLFDKQQDIRDFVEGFTSAQGKRQLISGMFGTLINNGASARYMRMLFEPHPRPLVRIDMQSGGNEYLLLDIGDNGKIHDLYTASSGRQASESVADASRLMVKPSANTLRKLFGDMDVDNEVLAVFIDVAQMRMTGQFAEAYQRLKTLPEQVKNQKVVINTAVQLAQNLDERSYSAELARLARHFGDDPSVQFMLIDYYYFTEQTDAGLQAITNLMARFGEDAVLQNLKANFYYSGGRVEKALEHGAKATVIEKDFMPAYWSLAQMYTEQEHYAELVALFSTMTRQFDWQFTDADFAADPTYRDFRMSDEYQRWMRPDSADN